MGRHRNKIKTTHREIADYWYKQMYEGDLHVDESEAIERCWRCTCKRSKLQRCHIVPDALGGTDVPSNYVLLCPQCHRDAPNINEHGYMWIWILGTGASRFGTRKSGYYGEYHVEQFIETYKKMFNHEPFHRFHAQLSEKSWSASTLVEFREWFQNNCEQISTRHFGEGTYNTSTLACLVHIFEKSMKK